MFGEEYGILLWGDEESQADSAYPVVVVDDKDDIWDTIGSGRGSVFNCEE